jgi:hypothetical protein
LKVGKKRYREEVYNDQSISNIVLAIIATILPSVPDFGVSANFALKLSAKGIVNIKPEALAPTEIRINSCL